MLLRSDIQMATIVKSLTDIVIPALGLDQKVASEQVAIIVGQLKFIEAHAPLQASFDLDELDRLASLARALATIGEGHDPDLAISLRDAALASDALKMRGADSPGQVLDAILGLRALCAAAVTVLYQMDKSTKNDMAKIVMSYSEQQLLRDRAWVVSQGWEAHPENLPKIESLVQGLQK